MASFAHVAVGMAAARWESRRQRPLLTSLFASMVTYSGLSLLPDADVLGFRFAVAYGAAWGHRGASHSLAFAALTGALAAALARSVGRPTLRTFALVSLVVGSHGLLDAMTDGGLGVALAWPFSRERFFAPITPIPVAPLGRGLLSARGLEVILTEAVAFAPLVLYSLWPRRAVRGM